MAGNGHGCCVADLPPEGILILVANAGVGGDGIELLLWLKATECLRVEVVSGVVLVLLRMAMTL